MNAVEAAALITKISLVDPYVTATPERAEAWAEVLENYGLDEAWATAKVMLRSEPRFNMASLVAGMNLARSRAPKPRVTPTGIVVGFGGPDGALLRGEIES